MSWTSSETSEVAGPICPWGIDRILRHIRLHKIKAFRQYIICIKMHACKVSTCESSFTKQISCMSLIAERFSGCKFKFTLNILNVTDFCFFLNFALASVKHFCIASDLKPNKCSFRSYNLFSCICEIATAFNIQSKSIWAYRDAERSSMEVTQIHQKCPTQMPVPT